MCQKLETRWSNHLIHTVSRGIRCCRVQEKWEEIKKLAEEVELEELTKFVCNLKDCEDYSGVLHRNTFQVNRKVGLIGLGFYGPHETDIASYDILVTIEDLRKKCRTLFSTEFYSVAAKKGQMFYVMFDKMIVLDPNRFYNIGFQLDGPKTGILDSGKVLQNVMGIRMVGYPQMEFTFLRGSLQMPEIKYVLLE